VVSFPPVPAACQLRAPAAVADVVLDVPLGDLRVRRPRGSYGVRVDVRRADAAGRRVGPLRQEDAGESHGDGGTDSHFGLDASVREQHEDTFGAT